MTSNELGLIILIVSFFVILIIVVLYREQLFINKDLYGKLVTLPLSECRATNSTISNCTDLGNQFTIQTCEQNPITGLFCLNENMQQSTDQYIRLNQCTQNCQSFAWEPNIVTPCLADVGYNTFANSKGLFCTTERLTSRRFRTYECKARDGSGPNNCTHTCNGRIQNSDCDSGGSGVLVYDPLTVRDPKIYFNSEVNSYQYFPGSNRVRNSNNVNSNILTISENCVDLNVPICGNWETTTNFPNLFLTPECITPNNALLSSGYVLTDAECRRLGVVSEYCNPLDNCINIRDVTNELRNSDRRNVCGSMEDDPPFPLKIKKPQQSITTCLYFNPNLSLTYFENRNSFLYYDPTDTYNRYKSIISIPLYMSNTAGFLSLYNLPCAQSLNNTLPPYLYNCNSSVNDNLEVTRCSWMENIDVFGNCGINFIEQNALILLFKPVRLISQDMLVCHIMAVYADSYIGWLSHNFPNDTTLFWNQGNFDSNVNSPGTAVNDLNPITVEFILEQTGDTYRLLTGGGRQINITQVKRGVSYITSLNSLTLTVATFGGESIAKSVSDAKVEINEERMSILLYARSNRETKTNDLRAIIPQCNVIFNR